jgi:hypothetical protein
MCAPSQPKSVSSVTVSPNTIESPVMTALASLEELVAEYRIAEVLPLFKLLTATAPFPCLAGSTACGIGRMLKIENRINTRADSAETSRRDANSKSNRF